MIQSPDMHGIASTDLPVPQWRKSVRSNNGGDCVEVASLGLSHLARDSKDPNGPVLAFSTPEWARFLANIKTGAFNLV